MPRVLSAEQSEARVVAPAWNARALSIQGLLLVSASFLLPAAAHAAGLPVRALLPMHWPVLLIGLCYGWRSGVIAGLAAPVLSYLISGMPYPAMLPSMTIELGVYGFIAGFLRQQLRWNAFLAVLVACIGGRVVFLAIAVSTGATGNALVPYLTAAMLPGLAAAVAQVLLLPPLASWVVEKQASP